MFLHIRAFSTDVRPMSWVRPPCLQCGAGNNAGNDDEETLADAESALSNVQRDQLNSVLSDIAALPPMCGTRTTLLGPAGC